jgi:Domain of unknown function (DUF4268)
MRDVEWDPIPEKTACRIGIHRQANIADRESWPELFDWLKDNAEKFKTVFSARVKEMQLPATDAAAQAAATDAAAQPTGTGDASSAVAPATNGVQEIAASPLPTT